MISCVKWNWNLLMVLLINWLWTKSWNDIFRIWIGRLSKVMNSKYLFYIFEYISNTLVAQNKIFSIVKMASFIKLLYLMHPVLVNSFRKIRVSNIFIQKINNDINTISPIKNCFINLNWYISWEENKKTHYLTS